jgi:hypothetical protein
MLLNRACESRYYSPQSGSRQGKNDKLFFRQNGNVVGKRGDAANRLQQIRNRPSLAERHRRRSLQALDPFGREGMGKSLGNLNWFQYEDWRFALVQQVVGASELANELRYFHGVNFYIVAARPAFHVVSFIFPTLDWRVRFSTRVPPQTAGLPTLQKPEPPHLESIRSYLAVAYQGARPIVQLHRQFQLSPRSV